MTSELRPAVELADEVWDLLQNEGDDQNAIGAIEADREAVRAEQAAEIERLRKLIEATSAHFLRLNTDHPIMWEGAIDAAMEAVCLEVERQVAELAKFKALAETLAGALELAECALSGANMNMRVVYRKVAEALRQYKEASDD